MDDSSWVVSQVLHDVLFAHWPVRKLAVPAPLELDTRSGTAWLGLVAFRVEDLHLRGLPPTPGLSSFPQINLRTYVTYRGKPGVLFLGLDVPRRALVMAGRRWYRLPYYLARMSASRVGDGVEFFHRRTHLGAPPSAFAARYHPTGPEEAAPPGTLEHFLTERYLMFAADKRGRVTTGRIHHPPWMLQAARAEIEINTAAPQPGEPHLRFARRMEIRAGPVRRAS